jgi:hypothetical protein
MNLPFSLEHVGPAWTPDYGLSASALNNWLWEDASLAGLEVEGWRETGFGLRMSALVGMGAFLSAAVCQESEMVACVARARGNDCCWFRSALP